MIDSHTHLYFDRFDADRDGVMERARQNGVDRFINIGIDVETSAKSVELARAHVGCFAAVGLHPTSPVSKLDEAITAIGDLAEEHRAHVVAIGEIGLDYYWKDIPPDEQKRKLTPQLLLATKLDLPVIFHCRDALEDLFSALEAMSALPGGVFHCFSGNAAQVERALELGYHVSFAGNVTYPKAKVLQEAALRVPPERILLETDCPFLPPQPRRGKRNEPSFLPLTCEFLSELRGVTPEELAEVAPKNTEKLFRLPA